ncbi:MAG: pseudouridine synthase [Sarcina sp.]
MYERLQKYMARCGIASRRKCEEIILSGAVMVNGEKINELGTKVDIEKDIVMVNGKKITLEESKVYIMLNKPTGVITSNSDEKNRKTILDIVKVKERIYPIGRLDYDTSGLLLLTNDGDIYNKVIHPRKSIDKIYIAKVNGIFTNDQMQKFESGVDIGDYVTSDAKIKILEKYNNSCLVEIKIHEGRNRQVRRMCAAFNHDVIALRRIAIGNIKLPANLKKGEWRFLEEKEVEYLNSL